MPSPLFPLWPKAGSSGAIPAILVPSQPFPPAPGAIVDDDDGSSWAFLQQTTLAVVLAATVATTGRAVQAQQLPNAWQDELPACGFGAAGGLPIDLWSASTGKPRIIQLGTDEVIVPQPASPALDDGSEAPTQWVVRAPPALDVAQPQDELPRITVDEDYSIALDVSRPRPAFALEASDDIIVPQPPATITGDEVYWLAPDPARQVIAFPAPPDTDQIVAQPTSISLDDGDWQPSLYVAPSNVWMPVPWQFGGTEGSVWGPIDEDYEYRDAPPQRTLVCLADGCDDPTIVPQPVPLHVDEDYWIAPPSFVTAARGAIVIDDNSEIVPQPVPLRLEEGVWEPPYVAPPVRWTQVSDRQDEIVPTIQIDELAPDPWLLLPAKRVIALPSLDEYDVALGVLNIGVPQLGITSVVFDASITVAIFDSLATRSVFDG